MTMSFNMNTRPRVLLFESNEVLRTIIFTVLRHQLLDIDTASSADQALSRLSRCDYALAIVDLDNPESELVPFFEALRNREGIVFVIALRDPRDTRPVDADLVSAILLKPVEIDTLAEVTRECASAFPPSPQPHPCPPAESELRSRMDAGSPQMN